MTVAEQFILLPPRIDYAGFTFTLQFTEHKQYGVGIGYVLTGCHSRKKYKREAWKEGYWEDHAVSRQISTMFSNYLFYEPLFDTSDNCLIAALSTLRQRMTESQLLPQEVYRKLRHDDLMICGPLRVLEG